VRAAAIGALGRLYQHKDIAEEIQVFTARFVERIIAMSKGDKDDDVTAHAIKILGLLEAHGLEVVPEEDRNTIFRMVLADNKIIQKAAAEFATQVFFVDSGSKSDASRLPRWVEFLQLCKTPTLETTKIVERVVEGMWECNQGLLLDFSGMTMLLLNESLDDEGCHSVALLLCATMKALHNRVEELKRRKATKAKVDTASAARDSATEEIMKVLPQLLTKFQSEPAAVCPILELIQYMNLQRFSNNRGQKSIMKITDVMCEILGRSASTTTLSTVPKALGAVHK